METAAAVAIQRVLLITELQRNVQNGPVPGDRRGLAGGRPGGHVAISGRADKVVLQFADMGDREFGQDDQIVDIGNTVRARGPGRGPMVFRIRRSTHKFLQGEQLPLGPGLPALTIDFLQIMATRSKKVLLKVIILGDSGYVRLGQIGTWASFH